MTVSQTDYFLTYSSVNNHLVSEINKISELREKKILTLRLYRSAIQDIHTHQSFKHCKTQFEVLVS